MREVCVGLNAFRASLAGVLRRVVMPAFMHTLLPVFMLGLGLCASGSAAALTLNAQQGLQRSASLAGELAVFMDPSGTLDIEAGARADLVLVEARSLAEAVVARPVRQLVVSGGRVVVRGGALVV